MHMSLVTEQALPAQQGWPVPPQAAHLPAAQTVPAALHVFPAQQAWLAAPQAEHCAC
jgi:hypothetical protein